METLAYLAFRKKRAKDFERIAGRTGGALRADDLHQEAWFAAQYHSEKRGYAIDWNDPEDQELILATLVVEHVWRKRAEKRRTVSADQEWTSADGKSTALLEFLPAGEIADPLALLERREEEDQKKTQAQQEDAILESYSQAVAYGIVLWHFDNIQARAAAYLAVAAGTLRKRIADAAAALKIQASLFDRIEKLDDTFMPVRGIQYAATEKHQYSTTQWSWEF